MKIGGYSLKLRAILDAGRKEIQEGKGIPHDEFWKEIEKESPSRAGKRPARKTGQKRKREVDGKK